MHSFSLCLQGDSKVVLNAIKVKEYQKIGDTPVKVKVKRSTVKLETKKKKKVVPLPTWNFSFIHSCFFTFLSHKGLLSAEIDPSNYFLWLMCFSKSSLLLWLCYLHPSLLSTQLECQGVLSLRHCHNVVIVLFGLSWTAEIWWVLIWTFLYSLLCVPFLRVFL